MKGCKTFPTGQTERRLSSLGPRRSRRRNMAASSSSSRGGEGSDTCPICLEPAKQEEAYLDHCFHSFCYDCIAHWSRVVTDKHSQSLSSIKCPLCKAENSSIIHGFNGGFFQRHYVNHSHGKRCLSSAHEFRLKQYSSETGITNNIFNVHQFWERRRYRQKNIWLQSWLRREIQALIQEEDVDIIVHHIHGVIESFLQRQARDGIKSTSEQKRDEFRAFLSDASRPFIFGQTDRFIDELEMFLASGLNIEAYDKVCMQFLGMSASGRETRDRDVESYNQYPLVDFVDEDTERTD